MTDPSSSQDEAQSSGKIANPKGEFWYSVYECIEGKPKVRVYILLTLTLKGLIISSMKQIDFDKLAERCHYKNASTARVMYNNKRKALLQSIGALPAPATDSPGKKRGRKPKDDPDGEQPKKRGRGRPPKKKEVTPVKGEETEAETELEWEAETYHY